MIYNLLIETEVEADSESGAAAVMADTLAEHGVKAALITVRDQNQSELDSFEMTEFVIIREENN